MRAGVVALALLCAGVVAAPPAVADGWRGGNHLPDLYKLPGQPAGSTFEGIGLDPLRGVFTSAR